MAEFDYLEDDEAEVVETKPVLDENIRKQLRAAEKTKREYEALKAELEAQRREVQFTRAGIPESGIGNLFRKAYDGPADAESIRKAAEEYGILPQQVQDSSNTELEALRRASGATIGSVGATPDAAMDFATALSSAESPEDVMKIVSGDLGKRLGLYTNRGAI
jgi:hypothetical protein